MNHDRLLTRVWDKQEKRMLAVHDNEEFYYKNQKYVYRGASDSGIIADILEPSSNDDGLLVLIPFGDRFVPMTCTGRKDKNKKLIYGCDILWCYGENSIRWEVFYDINYSQYLVKRYFKKNKIWTKESDDGYALNQLKLNCKIAGNKFENPELMEKNNG